MRRPFVRGLYDRPFVDRRIHLSFSRSIYFEPRVALDRPIWNKTGRWAEQSRMLPRRAMQMASTTSSSTTQKDYMGKSLCLQSELDRLKVLRALGCLLRQFVSPLGRELAPLGLREVRPDVLRDELLTGVLRREGSTLLNHQDCLDTSDILPDILDLRELLAGGGGRGLAAELEELLLEACEFLQQVGAGFLTKFMCLETHLAKGWPLVTFVKSIKEQASYYHNYG